MKINFLSKEGLKKVLVVGCIIGVGLAIGMKVLESKN